MPDPLAATLTRRALLEAGALVVGFCFAPAAALAQAPAPPLAPARLPLDQVDSFLAIRGDGTVVVYSGKVDLGTGHRIAMRQMVGEELGVGVDRIDLIEGDTALTPNQGPTAGSSGVMRGGVELRQAAATAREALLAMAARAAASCRPTELTLADGEVRAGRRPRVAVADAGGRPRLRRQDESEGAAEATRAVRAGRQVAAARPTCPPRSPAGTSTCTTYVVPGMLHGRVVRPPAVGAKVVAVDESSVAAPAGRARRARSPISSASSAATNGPRCARRASSRCSGARARR